MVASDSSHSPGATESSAQPLVSVITPTYNFACLISATIDSIVAQDYSNLEIIVADDGSTDNTQEVLRSYGDRIRLLALPHQGENVARNAAIKVSKGDYIAFLDHDDLWLPTKISEQVRAMEEQPEAGLCHTGWISFDESGSTKTHLHEPPDIYHGSCFETIFHQNGVGALTAMIRRTALPAHLFHEDIPITADYALWLDVLLYHKAIYIPKILAHHRRHPGQITHGRRERWKIYEAVSRMRLLERVRDDLPEGKSRELRSWTLEQLRQATYERHRDGDYGWAGLGFHLLRKYGHSVPRYHRCRAAVLNWIHTLRGKNASERRYLTRIPDLNIRR